MSRLSANRMPKGAVFALPAVAVIGFLAWPMLFTSSGMAQDWVNHLWFIWRQSVMIERNHQPGLFLNDGRGVFYPFYAFYGGTIYALAGALTVLLGDAPVTAYVLTYLIGFAAVCRGWYCLARMAGLGRWAAHVPGLLFVSSSYYLTLVYARGDWPEFIAVSTMPVLAASLLSVLRADRVKLLPALALAGSTVVFFGSHNITMLWGCTAFVLFAILAVGAVSQTLALISRRGVIRVALITIPAVLVDAWYLLPALAYGQRTAISQNYDFAQSLRATSSLASASHLFTFSRASVISNTPDFILALPVLAIVWIVIVLVASLVYGGGPWRRLLWLVSGLSVIVTIFMTHSGLILDLPHPYVFLQFSYRLETYVLMGISAAVLVTLVLVRQCPRRVRKCAWAAVAVVVVVSAVGAVQQVDGYPNGKEKARFVVPDRYVVFAPRNQPPTTVEGLSDYDDVTLPRVNPRGIAKLYFPPSAIRNERISIRVNTPPGKLVRTNLVGAPYVVDVTGARVVGRGPSGHIVLRIEAHKQGTPRRVSLSRAASLPLVAGRLISLLALVFLGLVFIAWSARRWRVRGIATA